MGARSGAPSPSPLDGTSAEEHALTRASSTTATVAITVPRTPVLMGDAALGTSASCRIANDATARYAPLGAPPLVDDALRPRPIGPAADPAVCIRWRLTRSLS